jgi:hypothetical protein
MKKFPLLMLALVLALALAACNGGNTTPTPDGNNDNTPAPTETPANNVTDPPSGNGTGEQNASSSIVERITVIERDAEPNAASHFDVRVISETLEDSGYGMDGDFGGCILVFELENISGRAVTVDISAIFQKEHGFSGTLIDQNVRFEPSQTSQFTYSFGEYDFSASLHLIIEYMNVRY